MNFVLLILPGVVSIAGAILRLLLSIAHRPNRSGEIALLSLRDFSVPSSVAASTYRSVEAPISTFIIQPSTHAPMRLTTDLPA